MENEKENSKCGKKMEIYSRIVGYFRPVENWNAGKKEEFKDRLEYRANSTFEKKVISPVAVTIKETVSEAQKEEAVVAA